MCATHACVCRFHSREIQYSVSCVFCVLHDIVFPLILKTFQTEWYTEFNLLPSSSPHTHRSIDRNKIGVNIV